MGMCCWDLESHLCQAMFSFILNVVGGVSFFFLFFFCNLLVTALIIFFFSHLLNTKQEHCKKLTNYF